MKKSPIKKQKLFILIFKLILSACGASFFIASLFDGETWHKPMSYLVTVVLPFAPDIVGLIFKWKPSDKLTIAYEIFLIFAMILGINLDLYKTFLVMEDGNSYFDKIVHLASGVLTAFVGKEILDANYDGKSSGTNVKKYNTFFAFLFLMGFTALIALLWECFEFGYDQIAGGSMQQLVSDGVADTMWDCIAALSGGLVASLFLKKSA